MHRQNSTHNFVEWLTHKVSDNTHYEDVLAHLGHTHGKSYTELANIVFQSGHKNLALSLLDLEDDDSKQVERLMEWSENTPAFMKAVESGNPDLIYTVMLKLRETMEFDTFSKTIMNFPLTMILYKKHCKRYDKSNLYDIYVQEGNVEALAKFFLTETLDNQNFQTKETLLASAIEAYTKSGNPSNASLCQEQLKLLRFQKQVDKEHPHFNFLGKTINETCSLLLKTDDLKAAEDFRSEFRIPEHRFWWLRIQSLAELGHWAGLETLSKTKKRPIGFEAFVDVCLENKNTEEALKYLPKVHEKLKVKYYIKAGCLEKAALMAFKRKDHKSLVLIRSRCKPESALEEKVKSSVASFDNANLQIWRSFSL